MNNILNRRDFIRAAGFAVASVALPGCGGGRVEPREQIEPDKPEGKRFM